MNKIKTKRLFLAGIITLVVFIGMEILVEFVIGRVIWGKSLLSYNLGLKVQRWGMAERSLNLGIALVNCLILIWLYAALRPMFGVGTKTALITSFYWLVILTAFTVNLANLGLYPWKIALIEMVNQLIELPVALIAGAYFYELK